MLDFVVCYIRREETKYYVGRTEEGKIKEFPVFETELTFGDYIVYRKRTYKVDCFYPTNPLYSNPPGLGLRDTEGEFRKIQFTDDAHLVQKATEEEIQEYRKKRELCIWRSYDREYGEFIVGDVVRYQGMITEVLEVNDEELSIHWNGEKVIAQSSQLQMICFQEGRLDVEMDSH